MSMTKNHLAFAAVTMACALFSIPMVAVAAYSHTGLIGGTAIGSSQVPLPNTVSYEYSFLSGQQQSQATISFSSNPIAAVSMASQVINPLGEIALSGGGILRYTFEVTAPAFTMVPINFLGVYSAFQNGQQGASSQVSFDIFSTDSSVNTLSTFSLSLGRNCGVLSVCTSFTTGGGNTSYTQSQPDQFNVIGTFQGAISVLTNANGRVAGAIQLVAAANVRTFAGAAGASAYIDPRIEIDAQFLVANPSSTLAITPGVGNQISQVPELNSLSLLLAGLGAIGFSVKRHQIRV
jgi:hypothetical protein